MNEIRKSSSVKRILTADDQSSSVCIKGTQQNYKCCCRWKYLEGLTRDISALFSYSTFVYVKKGNYLRMILFRIEIPVVIGVVDVPSVQKVAKLDQDFWFCKAWKLIHVLPANKRIENTQITHVHIRTYFDPFHLLNWVKISNWGRQVIIFGKKLGHD